MNTNILIIGQAPPAVKQALPYDTTMLYDWFDLCGISKDKAQNMFEFDAMVGEFTGYDSSGHRKPNEQEMSVHYQDVLVDKILKAEKIILLGNVPKQFFKESVLFEFWEGKKFLTLIHPSRRNTSIYLANKDKIIKQLKTFIYG